MTRHYMGGALLALGLVVAATSADVIEFSVDYTADAGGLNTAPLNGLAARATFSLDDAELTILLENTSTDVPAGFEVSDSLLVSLGFNLTDGVSILAGNSALIGPDSAGLGAWWKRGPGNSVSEEWIWTNDFGGDLMSDYAQVLSTSSGQGGGTVTRFDGRSGSVGGPYGGIAANPVLMEIPRNQRAVSDSILFSLTLSGPLTGPELRTVADTSIVEFGSDQRYLAPVPEPASLAILGLLVTLLRRRS